MKTEKGKNKKRQGCVFYLTISVVCFIIFLLIPGRYYAQLIDPIPERSIPDDIKVSYLWMPRFFNIKFMGTKTPLFDYEGTFKKEIGFEEALDKIKKSMTIDEKWEEMDLPKQKQDNCKTYSFSKETHPSIDGSINAGYRCSITLTKEDERTKVQVYLYKWINF